MIEGFDGLDKWNDRFKKRWFVWYKRIGLYLLIDKRGDDFDIKIVIW